MSDEEQCPKCGRSPTLNWASLDTCQRWRCDCGEVFTTLDVLRAQLAQEGEKNAQFRLALRGIHALPIETDKTGHPCKRIPCSSMFDMGAELGEIVAAMDTDAPARGPEHCHPPQPYGPEGEQP